MFIRRKKVAKVEFQKAEDCGAWEHNPYTILAEGPWATYLSFLGPNFLIYERDKNKNA